MKVGDLVKVKGNVNDVWIVLSVRYNYVLGIKRVDGGLLSLESSCRVAKLTELEEVTYRLMGKL